jgi:hypothetical protein
MTDEEKLAFDSAKSVTTQLITVASAIITLGVTFFEKFHPPTGSCSHRGVLIASWVVLGVSIVGGFWSWLAQTGTLAKPGASGLTIYRANIMVPAALQIITFLVGLALTIIYGSMVLPG